MASGSRKRVAEREEGQRSIKTKYKLVPMETVILTNMEPIRLDICWSPQRQRKFRRAGLYAFLELSILSLISMLKC
jgi:hypothetical protein